MPLCGSALVFAATSLIVATNAHLPTKTELTQPTWCFATDGGRDVESWSLQPDGSADVIQHIKNGEPAYKVYRHASWALKKNKLIIRVPKVRRRVLAIEKIQSNRLIFESENQAIPCRPVRGR